MSDSKCYLNSVSPSVRTDGITEKLVIEWCGTAARSRPSKAGKASLDATLWGILIAKLNRYMG